MPTLDQIARHWVGEPEFATAHFNIVGMGEPHCFRCAWFPPCDDPHAHTTWAKHSAFLDRCHLVDFARGGSNEPDNLVPLCHICHRDMPEYADGQRDMAIAWVNEFRGQEVHPWFTLWAQIWWDNGKLKTCGDLKFAWKEYRKAMVMTGVAA